VKQAFETFPWSSSPPSPSNEQVFKVQFFEHVRLLHECPLGPFRFSFPLCQEAFPLLDGNASFYQEGVGGFFVLSEHRAAGLFLRANAPS